MEFDYTSNNSSSNHTSASPPLSIAEINARATHFDYNPLIPLRYWLRTADTLLKESKIYLSEGNEQQAYLLLLRWSELVTRYLPKHPERSIVENRNNLKFAHSQFDNAMTILEGIKPKLESRYEAYQRSLCKPRLSNAASFHLRRKSIPGPLDLSMRISASPAAGPFSPPLPTKQGSSDLASHNLALEIARQEFEKRERIKRERRRQVALESGQKIPLDSAGAEIHRVSTPRGSSFNIKDLHVGPASYTHNGSFRHETEGERKRREAQEEEDDMLESIKAISLGAGYLEPQRPQPRKSYHPTNYDSYNTLSAYDFDGFPEAPHHSESSRMRNNEPQVGKWAGSYPTIPKRQHSPTHLISTLPPPPKYPSTPSSPSAPALPPKVPATSSSPVPPPPPPLSTQKDFSTAATLENGTPLRTIFLPASLRSTFLSIAHPNTTSNLETCGILCGTLIQNALFVSRLVIPEQEATSDTCATKDEEGLFEYCNTEDLMVFGWIHTHPTQTCFMSSVDLHTHAGYQLMMRESIAIVCAPSKDPSWGVFRLTDPPGVQTIVNCRNTGLFHPHNEGQIYTDAMRPGHVCEVGEMGFDVVDLRKTKW